MRSDRRFITAAVLVGLASTAGIFHLVNESERRVQVSAFESAANDRVSVFRWSLAETIGTVEAVSALYAASQEVEEDEFAAFSQSVLQSHSAIESLAWMPRSTDPADGTDRYPVAFIEPGSELSPYSHLDCVAEPECARALEHARSTGKVALTSQLELGIDGDLRRSVLAVLPIYSNDLAKDPASRAAHKPMGYAAAFINVGHLWEKARSRLTPVGLDDAIFGATAFGRMQLLHEHDARLYASGTRPVSKTAPATTTTDLKVGDSTWRIVSKADEHFFAERASGRPWMVLAFGLFTTALIGIQLYFRATHTETVLDTNLRLIAAHEELQRQRKQLRQIIDIVPHLIFVRDAGGRILLANQATADACGTTVAELIDEERGHMLGARLDSLGTLECDDEILRTNTPKLLTDVVFTDVDDQDHLLNVSKIPYSFLGRETDKQAVLCVAVDVTDIRDVEADRARLEAELRHSQKMESIGVLAGGIAHDFNNLLGSIIGNTELAVAKIDTEAEVATNLSEILDASEHASKLVRQILAFSRKEELCLSSVDAAQAVHNALDLVRPSIPSSVELSRDIDPLAGAIMADETQLAQVVMNLCTNAYQAMQDHGGVLEVSLQASMIDETKTAMRPGLEPGPHVRIRVHDTGSGMDDATLGQLFDPFFTTKGVGEGTGLGLSVVHGIVSSHGGRIFVESRLGVGTTFTVYLPSVVTAPKTRTSSSESIVDSGGREHVLLIDDDLALLHTAKEMLDVLGYEVTACGDPRDALRNLGEAPSNYDIVVTDQAMPGLTGTEVAREILKLRPDIPILVATGFSEQVTAESAAKFGLKGYISKPYRMKDLAQTLRAALGPRAQPEA